MRRIRIINNIHTKIIPLVQSFRQFLRRKNRLPLVFADKQHAKNCLGLNKKGGYGENSYNTPYNRFTKLRLNKAKYRYTKDLVALFVEAFDEIEIELFTEEEDAA